MTDMTKAAVTLIAKETAERVSEQVERHFNQRFDDLTASLEKTRCPDHGDCVQLMIRNEAGVKTNKDGVAEAKRDCVARGREIVAAGKSKFSQATSIISLVIVIVLFIITLISITRPAPAKNDRPRETTRRAP